MANLSPQEKIVLHKTINMLFVTATKGSSMQAVAEDEKLRSLFEKKVQLAQEGTQDLKELLQNNK
ncbi:hypothetical protein K8O68_12160 [Salipaludibacillus sp. CUR1]|uniref:hypothetical protein n=1 Tax=Salipaludibacillus sp. CUR1 TaxID=2820003 RepID=UPI001E580A37|nr:hypothetical protein [Salipaludibacillus sp. CUR1]MCE7793173.1 hypothetical protein [Salipaludibacillus sp. CUR1]